jgi:hypothetical protein
MSTTVVYMRLLGEPVDVWRPVQAEHLGDAVYRILPQEYDREIETWEFEPGSTVICGPVPGDLIDFLGAIRLA